MEKYKMDPVLLKVATLACFILALNLSPSLSQRFFNVGGDYLVQRDD
ncbi:hypothetical protein [uncultured Desulfobacter sp.]|nr:hypothetical protein [uncultured Desulfobacter sp.]